MCIFLIGFLEPEPFAHEGSDEVAVVAPPDVEAEGDRVKLYIQGPVEPIGVVEHEQEFPVFVHFLKDAVLSARKFKFPGRTHLLHWERQQRQPHQIPHAQKVLVRGNQLKRCTFRLDPDQSAPTIQEARVSRSSCERIPSKDNQEVPQPPSALQKLAHKPHPEQ